MDKTKIEFEVAKLINDYKIYDESGLDLLLKSFKSQSNLELDEYKNLEQIIISAVENKRHKKKMSEYTITLMRYVLTKKEFLNKILQCKTFDEIQGVIYLAIHYSNTIKNDKNYNSEIHNVRELWHLQSDYKNFGELAVYDTSLYIGYTRNLLPDKVFLYKNGADRGASSLVDLKVISNNSVTSLQQSDFPEYISNNLKCYHIENFLCIKKYDLERICKEYNLV